MDLFPNYVSPHEVSSQLRLSITALCWLMMRVSLKKLVGVVAPILKEHRNLSVNVNCMGKSFGNGWVFGNMCVGSL